MWAGPLRGRRRPDGAKRGEVSGRGVLAIAAAWALAAGATVPATAAPPDPVSAASDLDDARRDLDTATERLDQIDRELEEAEAEVAATSARLAEASASLTAVTADLSEAEAAFDRAGARERAATQRLVDADMALSGTMARFEDDQAALRDRVAQIYKYGGDAGRMLLDGVVTSRDMHEIAVTVRTVESMVERDESALARTVELARETADARADVAELRGVALRRRAEAARHRDRVAGLVARQRQLVADIEADQTARQAIYDRIADDREAAAALIESLERRVASLRSVLAEAFLSAPVAVPVDGPPPDWADRLPAHGRRWGASIEAAATSAGVDARLLAALVWAESNFTPGARSHAGAIGLAQLMPGTAAGLGVDPFDPMQNLVGGARYLRAQLVSFGRVDLALAAYNAGPGRVQDAGNRVPDIVETQLYVVRVLGYYTTITGT
jgi:soluble lytic murein transglycosylase-like protein